MPRPAPVMNQTCFSDMHTPCDINYERSFTALNCKRVITLRQQHDGTDRLMTSTSATTHRRGPYRTGVRRREQIIGAATAVFAEYGYAGGSVRTIADRIGVSPASLLQHFGSKEGLLMAVLEDWDRHTVEAQLTDVTGLDYFRRLPEVMAANVSNRGLLELFITMAAEASSPAHPAHAFIQRRYTDNLATLAGHLQQAVDAGDIEALTPAEISIEVRLVTAILD